MCSVATYFRYSSKRTWRQTSQPTTGSATATFLRVRSSSWESNDFTPIAYHIEIPTFIVAGHETTRYHLVKLGNRWTHTFISTATTWALYALTKDKKLQDKLRDELLTVSTDNPTMEKLNSLPLLDAVVREPSPVERHVEEEGPPPGMVIRERAIENQRFGD